MRITPAGAGKTRTVMLACSSTEDHPRRCGENNPWAALSAAAQGSPPQVRGKPDKAQYRKEDIGITPAGAGKTARRNHILQAPEDHPRRCGENFMFLSASHQPSGSPPQVRGKPLDTVSSFCYTGITPAGAGKTLKRSFRNQPFCSRAVQISFNFSNSLNVSLQSGSAR